MNAAQSELYSIGSAYVSKNNASVAVQPDQQLSSGKDAKSVIIFSIARGTSTLLYRVFSNLVGEGKEFPEGSALLEPFTQAYHIEHQLEGTPGFNRQEAWPVNTECAKKLVLERVKNGFTVIKELAYQLDENKVDDAFLTELFEYAEPLFLVRSPESTIPSGMYPYFEKGDVTRYSKEEAGFFELHQLFDRVSKIISRQPLIIEAEEYLENPTDQLSQYFSALGLTFKQEYLSFTPYGEQDKQNDPSFMVWGDTWYKNAFATKELKARKVQKCMASDYQVLLHNPVACEHLEDRLVKSRSSYKKLLQDGVKPGQLNK
ncbi:hypothetical protein [uncultured Endozoicomonas sp.]|uniref:hypothetical protein n=1 Tax=uncultured Endozoicomonas sp. TaxID=432652 RepID=UPI002626C4E4|nr:hypothetical protein [uncultured Endozoicomonas sp.]